MAESENLRPRFSIKKSRILSNIPKDEKKDFEPEKVLYVEIDDEITHIFDRLKRLKQKHIALVIPKSAFVLQSVVNLKILKKKIDELEKDVVLVTSDSAGLGLAAKAGIAAVERLFEQSAPKENSEQPSFRANIRTIRDKISISDVIRTPKPSTVSNFLAKLKERAKKKKQEKSHETRIVFIAPNKQALFTLILVSVLLMLAVAYIALPGATITLTPKSSILDPAFNVTFLDYEKNRNALENGNSPAIVLASYQVQPPLITKKFSYPATGKTFQGENARGVITVYNLSTNAWDLAATTRFQTNEGLVFRTPVAVRVPPARGNIPGNLDVAVIADEFDVSGQVIGTRGNIGPTSFILPGIKNEENRKKIYGQSSNSMTGGISQTVKSVSNADIQASQEKIQKDIQKTAVEELKKYLEQQNLIKKTNWSLLSDPNVINISGLKITLPSGLEGTSVDQFELTATYTVSGLAYDRQEFISLLKERVVTKIDPDKKIVKIQEDDISYRFLDQDTAAGRVRLTATMRAIQVYDLDPDKENGRRLLKKITDHIVGIRIQDAQQYLQQQTNEIARVDITTWPIWAPTIPNIADNIKFVIKEDSI